MIEVLRALQVLMVLAWAIPLFLFAPYVVTRAQGPCDTLRAAVWSVALSVIAFPLRWLFFGTAIQYMAPLELAIWSSLYVLGALSALLVTLATTGVCRGR